MLQFARDDGIPIEEREIDRSELYIVDEAFFCGTGVQIAPIASIDGRPVGDGTAARSRCALREALLRHRPRPVEALRRLAHWRQHRGRVAGGRVRRPLGPVAGPRGNLGAPRIH